MSIPISIIVPVYNTEQYIDQCITSILSQSFSQFELLLIDDGSTDKSGIICNKYADTDNRVKVIHKDNGGPSSAVNCGIRASLGKWIFFVDSDDWIDGDMLEKLYNAANTSNADIVFCGGIREYEQYSINIKMHRLKEGHYDKQKIEAIIYSKLINDGSYSGIITESRCARLFKKHLITGNLHYYLEDIRNGEDWILSISAILDCNYIYAIEDYYPYHYRVNTTSITQTYNERIFEKYIRTLKHIEFICKEKSAYNFSIQINKHRLLSALLAIKQEIIRINIDSRQIIVNRIKEISESDELTGIRNKNLFNRIRIIDTVLLIFLKYKFNKAIYWCVFFAHYVFKIRNTFKLKV